MKSESGNLTKTKKMVTVGIFSAIAFILQLIGSFVGLKIGGFLEIEFSDLPALIISMAYGPLMGVLIELIKNVLHCAVTSTGFIGEFANFVINGVFCLTAGIIYKYKKNFAGAIISFIAAVIVMVLAGVLANLFIMLPLYMPNSEYALRLSIVTSTIVPFNIVKGIVLSIITILLYKRISNVIK